MKKNYQKLTEEIAERGGLQTNSRQYFDPIYGATMEGNFLRSIVQKIKRRVKGKK